MEHPELLATEYRWGDLILNKPSMQMLMDVKQATEKGETCHTLFYGPTGTGKTLAACLLGKDLKRDVMRIDLSHVLSKYIGETEKNLERLFSQAREKSWILFFDEADALFGKRTNVKDSHDRYANQDISYIMKKVEKYKSLIIFTTRSKSNIDDAFIRRLQYVIHFPLPETPERLLLWQKALSKNNLSTDSIDLPQIAEKFRLSGGAIMNIVQKLREENSGISPGSTNDPVIDQLKNL